MSSDEKTYECELCGHAYTERYGSLVTTAGGAQWRCYPCQVRWSRTRAAAAERESAESGESR